jgi:Icc-related predicted phosphoesterase
VRDAISKYQPLVSLHGHIHESKGVAKLGRSLAVNPGSSYSDGVLQAALIDLDGKKAKVKYVLVNG